MAYRKMTVEYILDDREIEALEELLGKWQQYKGKDGSQPFEDWKLEDLFQAIMQYGCKYDISKHIKTDQYRHELIEVLCTMLPNDKITIKTTEGEITVELLRNGKIIDYNYTVDEDNDGYIQLVMGMNVIKYDADEGVEYLNVKFEYKNQYMFA